MASQSVSVNGLGPLVRIVASFTTSDTASTVRVYRTIPSLSGSGTARLRLSRGVAVGSAAYSGLVSTTDFPVNGLSNVAGVYSDVTFIDPEPPQGYALAYYIEVRNSSGTVVDSSSPTTAASAVDIGGDALYDLSMMGRCTVVNVQEFSELATSIKSTVSIPLGGGTPVVGVDVNPLPSFQLRLVTQTAAEARTLRGYLYAGGPLYALSPRSLTYGFDGPVYFAVTDYKESRATNLGIESTRLWTLSCQQVSSPAAYYGATPVSGATLSTRWASFYLSYSGPVSTGVTNSNFGIPFADPTGTVV